MIRVQKEVRNKGYVPFKWPEAILGNTWDHLSQETLRRFAQLSWKPPTTSRHVQDNTLAAHTHTHFHSNDTQNNTAILSKHLCFNMLPGSVCESRQGWVSGKSHCVWLTSTFVTDSLWGLCNYTLYVTLALDSFLAWLLLPFPSSSSGNETSGIPPLFPYSEAAKPPPSIVNTYTALYSFAGSEDRQVIHGRFKLNLWRLKGR